MPQSGYTPIQLYRSTTSGVAPAAVNLTNGELALNYNAADMALYAKNGSGSVIRLINNPAGLKYPTTDGTANQFITTDAAGNLSWDTAVGTIAIASSNGFAGTSSGGHNPAITLTTTVTGVLKGNGTAISAAVSGTDYAPATSGNRILYGNDSGGFSNVTIGSGVSFAGGVLSATGAGGTVTNVSALTLGTTGTDLSSSVATSTTTPVITLNVPTASATNRGALSSSDWTTFNNKVTSVSATAPVSSTGGTTPVISMAAATSTANGYLTNTDWNTFNNKQPAGAYLTSVTVDAPLSGSGTSASNLSIPVATSSVNGYLSSTDWSTFNSKVGGSGTANYVPKFTSSSAIGNSVIYDDGTNVGIGTSMPVAKLQVSGTTTSGVIAEFVGNTSYGSFIQIDQPSIANIRIGQPANVNALAFYGFGGGYYPEQMRLDSSGNLGLGVTPSAWGSLFKTLDIGSASGLSSGAVGQPILSYNLYNDNTNNRYKTTGYASKLEQASGGFYFYTAGTGAAGSLVNGTGNFTQAMTLDASGNVGVGVTPSAWSGGGLKAIEIVANGNSLTANASTTYLNTNAYYNGGWKYGYSGSAAQYYQSSGAHYWLNAGIGIQGNPIAFTQAMTLDTSGNLGLGVTPSAWTSGSGTKAFQIGAGAFTSVSSLNDLNIWSNAYLDSTSTPRYLYSTTATQYRQVNGQHWWLTAPSGLLGTPVTFTQAMTLDASGNLGIGTSSPTYQLQLSTDSAAKPSTNTWTIASDERIKTVTGEYTKGLEAVCALRPITYEYNGKAGFAVDGKENISIIAQEAMEHFPECVGTFEAKLNADDEATTKLYNWNGHALTFALVNAIKEQQILINQLTSRIAALEGK